MFCNGAALKDNKLLVLGVCKSSLFHSEIAYGKSKFLSCSVGTEDAKYAVI